MAAFALLVATTLGAASAFTTGCLIVGQRFTDGTKYNGQVLEASSCQNLCANETTCNGFTYFPDSDECWFSASGASTELVPQQTDVRAYAGPKNCTVPPAACSATLTGAWPGSTPAESNAAFSTGYQPAPLQCWPYDETADNYDSCSEVTILDNMADGWPGRCLGLMRITLSNNQTCENTCRDDVTCAMYQKGDDGSCWQGLGEGCYDQPSWNQSFQPEAAQRFQRGDVIVMKDMKKIQILGLKRVFDKEDMDMMGMDVAKIQCKKSCYSALKCQYWQLNEVSGCWIEGANALPYPLTAANVETGTADANNTIAGEYIQRRCTSLIPTVAPPPSSTVPPTVPPTMSTMAPTSTTTTTTTTEAAGGFPWWGWLLLALVALCCICGIIACVLASQKPKKAKKAKRTLRPQQPVQQPVPTMQTAMPVYYAAPVATAPVYTAAPPQPTYTYTAPPPMASVGVPAPASRAAPLPVQPAGMPQPMSAFDRMDRDGDGVITRAEFQAAAGGRM